MHITKIKRVIALAVLLAAAGLTGLSYTGDSPSNEAVTFAERTSDLMLNELLAALFQEFNETTADNVEEGKQAISLIFNDANRDMRLIGVFPHFRAGPMIFPATRLSSGHWPSHSRASRIPPSSAWAAAGTIVARLPSATLSIRPACSATRISPPSSSSKRITRDSGWARSRCGCRSRVKIDYLSYFCESP